MKRSCLMIFFISIVEFASQDEKADKFHALRASQDSESKMLAAIDPISVVGAIIVWDCVCDKVCDLGERFITPFIEMLGDFHDPADDDFRSLLGFDIPSLGEIISHMKTAIQEGYRTVKEKLEDFYDDVEETIVALITKGSKIATQYYSEVIIYRNRTNPLELFCEKSRKYGFCSCLLKKVTAYD